MTVAMPRFEVLKALGDATRYAIFCEVAGSPQPLSTSDLSDALGLHPNTVRPHLERLREVGLLEVTVQAPTGVGRPHHLYATAPGAPSLGLQPSSFPLLARMLLRLAAAADASSDDAAAVGREQGRADAALRADAASCLEALVSQLDAAGFDPLVTDGDEPESAVVAFAHCPFRELAEAHPQLVCSLHRGLVEGLVDAFGSDRVEDFHSLVDRTPCQVTLVSR